MTYRDLHQRAFRGGVFLSLIVCSVVRGGLVAHYKFDETIGATTAANAVVVNGGDGAIGANVILGATGVTGSAITLSGGAAQADIVDMGNATGIFNPLIASGQFTISYWMSTVDTGNRNVAVFLGNDADSNDYVDSGLLGSSQFAPAGTAYGRNRDNTNTSAEIGDIGGTTLVNDGKFHHIAFTVNTAGGGAGAFYVDGTQVASGSGLGFDAFPDVFNNLEVGRLGRSAPVDGLAGSIDDLQIYDTALSAQQIRTLNANPGTAIPEPSTVVSMAFICGLVAVRRRMIA